MSNSGYKGAKFKSFLTLEEARCFINPQSSYTPTTLIATTPTTTTATTTTMATGRQRAVKDEVADQQKELQRQQQHVTKVGLDLANTRSPCYAVAKGHTPGLYSTWDECKRQTKRFSCPVFKKLTNGADAVAFMAQHSNDWNSVEEVEGKRTTKTTTNMELIAEKFYTTEQQGHRSTKLLKIQLWFDGGSRGNPGISGSGAHLIISVLTFIPRSRLLNDAGVNNDSTSDDDNDGMVVADKDVKVVDVRHYCGENYTNNYAEYCGLREGLLEAKHHVDEFCSNIVGTNPQYVGLGLSPTIACSATYPKDGGENDTYNDWCYQIKVDIKGDSNMIIEQLNGNYACRKETLKILYLECIGMISDIRQKADMKIASSTKLEKKRKRNVNDPTTGKSDHNHISVVVSHMHVYRNKNTVADALANEAMDKRKSWTTYDEDSGLDGDVSIEVV